VNKKQEREKCKILPYFGAIIVKYEAVKFETTFCIGQSPHIKLSQHFYPGNENIFWACRTKTGRLVKNGNVKKNNQLRM
jgi:hypothetical protein